MDMIEISKLKPHPRNTEIYGIEDVEELAAQIQQSNWINPLIINQDNIVISGHRRLLAVQKLGIEEVPYIRQEFKNELEELETLLLANDSREKTVYQKLQEGLMWESIEKEKAKQRQATSTGGKTPQLIDTIPQADKGNVIDIIASKIKIGSGKTYARGRQVSNKINELKTEGKEKEANFLITILNENVAGAKTIVDKNVIDQVPEELKDRVLNKELQVKKAITEIKKTLIPKEVKENDKENNNKDENIENNINEDLSILGNNDLAGKFTQDIKSSINVIDSYIKLEDKILRLDKSSKTELLKLLDELEEKLGKIKGFVF